LNIGSRMGKNHTIYFNDEVEELIGSLTGKGTLINGLVLEHFNNDEETLRRKIDTLEQEFNAMNAKLKLKVTQRQERENKVLIEKKQSVEQLKRKKDVADHQERFRKGEITEKEYWEFFDK